jgi:hypothetical protein
MSFFEIWHYKPFTHIYEFQKIRWTYIFHRHMYPLCTAILQVWTYSTRNVLIKLAILSLTATCQNSCVDAVLKFTIFIDSPSYLMINLHVYLTNFVGNNRTFWLLNRHMKISALQETDTKLFLVFITLKFCHEMIWQSIFCNLLSGLPLGVTVCKHQVDRFMGFLWTKQR